MFREIKNFIQRGKRGYSDEDLWDLDEYLGRILYESVRDFRAMERMGYPPVVTNKRRWNQILERLERGLSFYDKLDITDYLEEGKVNRRAYSQACRNHRNAIKLLAEYIDCLWD